MGDAGERSDRGLDCAVHGVGVPYGFMCGHLFGPQQVGWLDAGSDELCPDAWCEACEETRKASGGWTDENGAAAGVRVVCACCYHRHRGRQRRFNHLDPSTPGTLMAGACRETQDLNDRLEADHELFSRGSWHFDLGRQQLDFTEGNAPRFHSRVAVVGSYSEATKTWLWAWANSNLSVELSARSHAVLGYADRTGRNELLLSKQACTLDDAWHSAAGGAALMGARGLYRCPFESLHLFFALLDLRPAAGSDIAAPGV